MATVVSKRPAESAPLSFAQHRLWALEQLYPGQSGGNEQFAVRIEGPVDPVRLARSWDAVIARHDALRVVFFADPDGVPVQVIDDAGDWRIVDRIEYLRSVLPSGGLFIGGMSWLRRSLAIRAARFQRRSSIGRADGPSHGPGAAFLDEHATDLMVRAWHRYEYPVLDIGVTLVYRESAERNRDSLESYWRRYFTGKIDIEFVVGASGHADLMQEPHIASVANIVDALVAGQR